MKQIPKLNYASGSVTVLTERQKSPTVLQVCSLVITILKLLPNPSVTAAFKKSLAMKQVLSPRLHTHSGNYLLGQSKKFLSISFGFRPRL